MEEHYHNCCYCDKPYPCRCDQDSGVLGLCSECFDKGLGNLDLGELIGDM